MGNRVGLSQRWAARALAYAAGFDNPLARMAGLMFARAWLAVIHPPFSAGRQAGFGSTS